MSVFTGPVHYDRRLLHAKKKGNSQCDGGSDYRNHSKASKWCDKKAIVRGIWNAVQNHQSHDMERKQEAEATSGRLAANKNEGQKASSDIGRIQIRKQTIEDGE